MLLFQGLSAEWCNLVSTECSTEVQTELERKKLFRWGVNQVGNNNCFDLNTQTRQNCVTTIWRNDTEQIYWLRLKTADRNQTDWEKRPYSRMWAVLFVDFNDVSCFISRFNQFQNKLQLNCGTIFYLSSSMVKIIFFLAFVPASTGCESKLWKEICWTILFKSSVPLKIIFFVECLLLSTEQRLQIVWGPQNNPLLIKSELFYRHFFILIIALRGQSLQCKREEGVA